MRQVGFSTGSLGLGDFRRGIQIARAAGATAIELSALRFHELEPLVRAVDRLDLAGFAHVSVHAPSSFPASEEESVMIVSKTFADRGWPIVLHPDAIHSFHIWRILGRMLLIENMDKRKPTGRTATELRKIYVELPEAALCFDIAHARQYDPSMNEAYLILREHASRLVQLHVSEVNTSSRHARLTPAAIRAYQELAHLIPPGVPLILETPVDELTAGEEMRHACQALTPTEVARVLPAAV